MKKLVWLLFFVVASVSVCAYVEPINYNGILIKLYTDEADINQCTAILDYLSPKYYEGIYYIQIFEYGTHRNRLGEYWSGTRGIKIFNYCDWDTIIHEIAHDVCERRYSYDECIYFNHRNNTWTHLKPFFDVEWELWVDTQTNGERIILENENNKTKERNFTSKR